jgi:hypothetical protein
MPENRTTPDLALGRIQAGLYREFVFVRMTCGG